MLTHFVRLGEKIEKYPFRSRIVQNVQSFSIKNTKIIFLAPTKGSTNQDADEDGIKILPRFNLFIDVCELL